MLATADIDDPLHTVHKFNRGRQWDSDGGGAGGGGSGIYGVVKHMTDDPHRFAYGPFVARLQGDLSVCRLYILLTLIWMFP